MARSLPSVLHTTPSPKPPFHRTHPVGFFSGKTGSCIWAATARSWPLQMCFANGDLLTTDAAAVPPMRLKPSGGRQFLEKSMCYLLELNLIMSSAIISYSNRFLNDELFNPDPFFHPKRLVGSDFFASNIFQINVSPFLRFVEELKSFEGDPSLSSILLFFQL